MVQSGRPTVALGVKKALLDVKGLHTQVGETIKPRPKTKEIRMDATLLRIEHFGYLQFYDSELSTLIATGVNRPTLRQREKPLLDGLHSFPIFAHQE